MKKLLTILACCLAVALCVGFYTHTDRDDQVLTRGGVLRLSVNPAISVYYDADGNVTNVEARNEDGTKILADFTGFEGKACKSVVAELVTAIGKAGYFVEEVEGGRRRITLEVESGSQLPDDAFLDEIAAEVRRALEANDWSTPIAFGDDDDRDDIWDADDWNDDMDDDRDDDRDDDHDDDDDDDGDDDRRGSRDDDDDDRDDDDDDRDDDDDDDKEEQRKSTKKSKKRRTNDDDDDDDDDDD